MYLIVNEILEKKEFIDKLLNTKKLMAANPYFTPTKTGLIKNGYDIAKYQPNMQYTTLLNVLDMGENGQKKLKAKVVKRFLKKENKLVSAIFK